MTRKHFEAIAAEFRAITDEISAGKDRDDLESGFWDGAAKTHQALAERMVDVCATYNPNFDRARFLTACGLED